MVTFNFKNHENGMILKEQHGNEQQRNQILLDERCLLIYYYF